MQEFNIAIHCFPEVRDFISLATVQPFEVFVGNDHQVVNAKGFIGMASLDFSHPLTVLCDCDPDCFRSFRQQASRFLV